MKIKLSELIDNNRRITIKNYTEIEHLRVYNPISMIEAFDEVCITENLKFGFFTIPFSQDRFDSDGAMIQMVTEVMNNVGYRPGTLGDLISYIIDNPQYASESNLGRLCHSRIVAFGSVGTDDDISFVPLYNIHMESLGSSIDRDLSYYYYPRLDCLYFRESKNPCHHRLMYGEGHGDSLLAVLNE